VASQVIKEEVLAMEPPIQGHLRLPAQTIQPWFNHNNPGQLIVVATFYAANFVPFSVIDANILTNADFL
jgi:hypothetical protein